MSSATSSSKTGGTVFTGILASPWKQSIRSENDGERSITRDNEGPSSASGRLSEHTAAGSPVDTDQQREQDAETPKSSVAASTPSPLPSNQRPAPHTKADYPVGSFVIVKHASCDDEYEDEAVTAHDSQKHFWVAKVLQVTKNLNTNYASQLTVQWYDCDNPDDEAIEPLQDKYHPCYRPKKKRKLQKSNAKLPRQQLQEAWKDTIDTDTVLVSFDKLTKRHNIPLATQKKMAR